jgi:predicted DNA binding CopG/RHH family protein
MKRPKTTDLIYDAKGTLKIRKKMSSIKKSKITINIDEDILLALKTMSSTTGVPYQTLLNRLLRQQVSVESENEARLDKLEREVANLKKKSSA